MEFLGRIFGRHRAPVETEPQPPSAELMRFSDLKFVRDRDQVVVSLGWKAHKDIARDAGFVKRDSEKPNSLIVYERSTSLGVSPNKKNRPETVKVLSKMAPNVKVEAVFLI